MEGTAPRWRGEVSEMVLRERRARKLGNALRFLAARERRRRMRRLIHAIKEDSLTIVLFALFAVCIFAQSFAGWRLQNETLAAHGQAAVGYWHNLSTGTFLEGLATNWQAAFLQLASLIVFSGFLYQRGAPHSRDPLKPKNRQKKDEEAARFTWLYRNSLFLAFVAAVFPLARAGCGRRQQGLQRGTRARESAADPRPRVLDFG